MVDTIELIRLHDSGLTWSQVGQRFGMTKDACKGRVKRWRHANSAKPIRVSNGGEYRKIPTNGLPDDTEQWEAALKKLPPIIRFGVMNDLHVPDHNLKAVELALKIISDFKPHILQASGSDALSFENISTHWEVDPEKMVDDVFEVIENPYRKIMTDIHSAAPDAIYPNLVGNHEKRLITFLNQKAPQLKRTVLKTFIELIRSTGALWLGFNISGYKLHHLRVIHGYSTAKFAASVHLDRFDMDIVSGDVHRAMYFARTVEERIIQSVTTGCLCNLTPSYAYWQSNWQHGICLITIDTVTNTRLFENIVFCNNTASYGGRLYRV